MTVTVPDEKHKKLGEVNVNKEAFELDLKVNDLYLGYSAELLRLSLLLVAGLAAVWLKLYLPETPGKAVPDIPRAVSHYFGGAFVAASLSAGAALIHRYTAADSLAFHLTALRRRSRNRAGNGSTPSDAALADKQEKERNLRFSWAGRLLRLSVSFLFLALVLSGFALARLMF